MDLLCEQARLTGNVRIPGSKSHTIRAVAIAALARGESHIGQPLYSEDAQAAVRAYRALGAEIEQEESCWHVQGTGGELHPPAEIIDVANSGTTLRMVMGACALLRQGKATLTGDAQIQRRPSGILARALTGLGASARSLNTENPECPPFEVKGRMRGGRVTVEAVTSQYLSSLLINTPLADGVAEIHVPLLNERPYVEMTLDWLQRQGIRWEQEGWTLFRVPGGQQYTPVNRDIPADFSSATFFLAAGALGNNDILVQGLDMNDTQGDKAVIDYIRQMGADITKEPGGIRVRARRLQGAEFDLNATPDALPMMAALACFAEGETRLVNVPQARLKETDRIAVMREELSRLGADIEELPDGLVIRPAALRGAEVSGHDDHRVIMALAIAASAIDRGTTIIRGCDAMNITYPQFVSHLEALGGKVRQAGD